MAVLVPSIPIRGEMLARALASVAKQTRPVDQIVVSVDHAKIGAPSNIAKAFDSVRTDWVVKLDDDDWLREDYIERMVTAGDEASADVVYCPYLVVGGTDPFPYMHDLPYSPELLDAGSCIPGGGAMMRCDAVRSAGGFPIPGDADYPATDPRWPGATGEDYALWLRMRANGAKFFHLMGDPLWYWEHHGHNTSGNPNRW